jgi:hypothetical protein
MTEPWVSVDEGTGHLGVARNPVSRWMASRSLPAHEIGPLGKHELSEVDGWVRAGGADADDRAEKGGAR